MLGVRCVLAILLMSSAIYLTKGRIVKKGNTWYFDQDCKTPVCARPQRLVCPTKDPCDCFCKDVPCYVPSCAAGCQASCFTRPGFCQCKCIPLQSRCADPWEKECLPVCVGANPCKCNCVGAFQPYQRNEYKNSSLTFQFSCTAPPQVKRYPGKRK
uniref:Putative metastriate ixostatin family member n=1 Tax=Rhipicephalus pulchellus TaxID=72859 RepID=L7M9M0_RHIPC